MLRELGPADEGEWVLRTRSGRVQLVILPGGEVRWRLVRDTIGLDADLAAAAGDAVDWESIRIGEVSRVGVDRSGDYGPDVVSGSCDIRLPAGWRVTAIMRSPQADEFPELIVEGQVRRCWHDAGHASRTASEPCGCECGCCRDGSTHVEHVVFGEPLEGPLTCVTQTSVYVLDGGSLSRVPDGDPARAETVAAPILVGIDLKLGGRLGPVKLFV